VSGRGAAVAVGIWTVFIAALAGLLLGFRNNLVEMLSWAGALVTLMVVLVAALRAADPPVRVVPDASAGALLLALAIALMALAAALGAWAVFIGGGLAVAALAVLARERRR
jgi:hypothetical protein